MQTKGRITDLLISLRSVLLIVIPVFATGRLLDPPYNVIGWGIILAIGSVRFVRDPIAARVSAWRAARTRHISGHGASR